MMNDTFVAEYNGKQLDMFNVGTLNVVVGDTPEDEEHPIKLMISGENIYNERAEFVLKAVTDYLKFRIWERDA